MQAIRFFVYKAMIITEMQSLSKQHISKPIQMSNLQEEAASSVVLTLHRSGNNWSFAYRIHRDLNGAMV